ncbi:MAG: FAD-dependent hydroxylase [Desertifilum sp. SIO1I2]|nr:FAD-dependent hydroxylase [Desertifilum sp. SIO1I2]
MARFPEVQSEYTADVAIVGAGIVGATLACALKDSGLQVVLIEAQPQEQAIAKRQAYALSLMSGRIFQGLGLWETILPQINTFKQIRLSDADYSRFVRFSLEDLGTEALGYVGEHRVLLSALYEALEGCSHVTWLCPAQVETVDYCESGASLQLTLEAPGGSRSVTVQSRLVVAADGSRSRVRELAGIKTHGWKYWQSCVATTIRPTDPHPDTAYERFWPSGPMGVLPLPGNRYQVVWTAPHAEAKALQNLDEKAFLALLEERTGGLLGRLELDAPRAVFPVQLMQSDRYVLPHLALVGDAAHCCHPVGGQGLNMGIRDAAVLAQTLAQAQQQGEEIGTIQVLGRYERWRKRENLAILGFTDFLDRTFSNTFVPVVAMRRCGLWMLHTLQSARYLALRLMTGLFGRSPNLAQP